MLRHPGGCRRAGRLPVQRQQRRAPCRRGVPPSNRCRRCRPPSSNPGCPPPPARWAGRAPPPPPSSQWRFLTAWPCEPQSAASSAQGGSPCCVCVEATSSPSSSAHGSSMFAYIRPWSGAAAAAIYMFGVIAYCGVAFSLGTGGNSRPSPHSVSSCVNPCGHDLRTKFSSSTSSCFLKRLL
jgi:hypothetical protein